MWRWEVAMWGMSGSGACLKVRAVGVGKSVGAAVEKEKKGGGLCVCVRACVADYGGGVGGSAVMVEARDVGGVDVGRGLDAVR